MWIANKYYKKKLNEEKDMKNIRPKDNKQTKKF